MILYISTKYTIIYYTVSYDNILYCIIAYYITEETYKGVTYHIKGSESPGTDRVRRGLKSQELHSL